MKISHLYLVVLINTVAMICVQSTTRFRNPWALSNTLIVYKNLDELLSIIKKDPSPLAAMLVETFNSECRYRREHKTSLNRTKPFIVIEGNHRKSQDIVGRTVAKQLNAKYVTHPAYCIAKYLRVLTKGSFLLKAFFHLSNYAANYYVRYRHNSTIVLNGYWMQQLAYTVNGAYSPDKLPAVDSEILSIPDDLIPPDITFFLDLPDTPFNRTTTPGEQRTWKNRTKGMMRLLQTRYPVEMKTIEPDIDVTSEEILKYTTEQLRDRLFGSPSESEVLNPMTTPDDEADYC